MSIVEWDKDGYEGTMHVALMKMWRLLSGDNGKTFKKEDDVIDWKKVGNNMKWLEVVNMIHSIQEPYEGITGQARRECDGQIIEVHHSIVFPQIGSNMWSRIHSNRPQKL